MAGLTRFTLFCLRGNFESILFLCSSFPSPCGFMNRVLEFGIHWGLLGVQIHSLDRCIRTLGAFIGRDPSRSQFEFV
jgi:hypothetical protein